MLEKLFGRKKKPAPPPKPQPIVKVWRVNEPPKPVPLSEIHFRQCASDPAPIIADPSQRGFNIDFRREDDEPFVFRVNQHQPKGYPKRIAKYVSVAGVSYRQPAVIAFIEGRNREIEIRPEVVTEGRAPSLAIYGQWEDWDGGKHEAHLGYVPKDVHLAIGETPVVATLEAMYQGGKKRMAGLRIDIWQQRPRREKPQQ